MLPRPGRDVNPVPKTPRRAAKVALGAAFLAAVVIAATVVAAHARRHRPDVEGFGRQYMQAVDADPSDALAWLPVGQALCAERHRGDFDITAAVRRGDPSFSVQGPSPAFVNKIYAAAVDNLCPWRERQLGRRVPDRDGGA